MAENNNADHVLEAKSENTTEVTGESASVADANSNSSAAAEDAENEKTERPISEARLRANRENAKKSTGPRTPEGKQRSSLNGTRHGILAQVIVLPKEDMEAYNKFTSDYAAAFNAVGTVEIQLAHACADIQFRLHRRTQPVRARSRRKRRQLEHR